MNFPDLNHFLQLRKDLWRWPNSRAALMVGAGISLNAEPVPGGRRRFLTWRQLTKAMFEEIYPTPDGPDERRRRLERFNNTSHLRIASEYDAAFRPSRLASFIREHVPDADHNPGPIHRLLLQLPWRDVFTTNYDTLLERTEVAGRAYQPVTTTLDLTNAYSPRIVKLHGSLPSHTPFIITEEHYRTYPTRYAPFVNTVRQSLIENSLILVGFSGDDPNFLEWTGWIRDELGSHHAPIYLVGWLSLDNVQRSLLVQRGVTPIDLAPPLIRSENRGDRHVLALRWFLSCLLSARPQRPESWPEPRTTSKNTDSHGESCPADDIREVEVPSVRSDVNDKTVAVLVRRWEFERLAYPGWLVPTAEMRTSLWDQTSNWAKPLIEWTKSKTGDVSIHIMRELNWRIETSMVPIFDDFREPFDAAVNELFPGKSNGDGSDTIPDLLASDSKTATSWLEVALALLRNARENYDTKRWTVLDDRIKVVVLTYSEFADRHRYEQALWKTWNLDMDGTRSVVQDWSPSSHSPLARMWKAGLLAELDQLTESRAILRDVLGDVRRSLRSTQGHGIHLLSLEGWCTYLLFTVEQAMGEYNLLTIQSLLTRKSKLKEEFSERWQELKVWDCSPWPLVGYFRDVLSDTPPVKTEPHTVVHDFDPGSQTATYVVGSPDTVTPWLPAFAYIRLLEQVGIPIRLRHINITGETLGNACKWTVSLTNFWSPALLIRAGKTKDLKRHFMDRTQVATMTRSLSRRLTEWTIEALVRQRTTLDSSSLSLVEALVEVLSRLTIRMQSSELQRAFEIAISLYQTPEVYRHLTLSQTCGNWFSRLFTAADDQQLVGWIPDLLRFPLSAPNPMRYLSVDRVGILRDKGSSSWTEIEKSIDWLLQRSSSESGDGRNRAIARLSLICIAGLMSETHRASFATVLWANVDRDALPDLPDFSNSVYLHLPYPNDIDVISRIKTRLLGSTMEQAVSVTSGIVSVSSTVSKTLEDLAFVSKPVIEIHGESRGTIAWNSDEAGTLWQAAVAWWDNEKQGLSLKPDIVTSYLIDNIKVLGMLMQRLLPMLDLSSDNVWNQVEAILAVTRKKGIFLTAVLPYILIRRRGERERVVNTISEDLEARDADRVDAGAKAIRHLVHLATGGLVEVPTRELVDALIYRVAFRRPEGIQQCMEQLSYLIVDKPEILSDGQVSLLVSALPAWRDAVSLPRAKGDQAGFAEDDRPELRVRLGELASALSLWVSDQSEPEPPAILSLRESYVSDTLPEVRRSFDKWMYLT